MKNEYTTIGQFTSQYVGEWNPSENHWIGLDFIFDGKEYRLNTGNMYKEDAVKSNEKDPLFYLYQKKEITELDEKEYQLLGRFLSMDDLLKNTVIRGIPFNEIIVDPNTELVGQD